MSLFVEDDQKAPFSIASTPRCWGGRYSFPWIAPLYPWSWSQICFSADAHMANRKWGPPMPISPCNDWEGWRRDGLSHFHNSVILAYNYGPLMATESQLPSPITSKCIRVSYFLVTPLWSSSIIEMAWAKAVVNSIYNWFNS